jgi:hypothetical protein
MSHRKSVSIGIILFWAIALIGAAFALLLGFPLAMASRQPRGGGR